MERTERGTFKKGTHWRQRKPWWDREWLEREYVTKGRSAGEIAVDGGVRDTAIHYWLKKHGIPGRTTAESRSLKYWGASGSDNPMWNMRGELNPRWKGGVTPERQAFYTGQEWKDACSSVWKRDDATCQRCNLDHRQHPDIPMHIHHIVSFSDRDLRAASENLVLVCEPCHWFIHSKDNTEMEFLRDV